MTVWALVYGMMKVNLSISLTVISIFTEVACSFDTVLYGFVIVMSITD